MTRVNPDLANLAVRVAQHVKQSFQKARKEVQNVDAGHIVHHVNPRNKQPTDMRTRIAYVLLHQRNQLFHVEGLRLRDNLLQQLVEQGCALA